MRFPYFKNSKGEPSASLTMLLVTWIALTFWLLLWLAGAWIGVTIPAFDATAAVAYLTPIIGLYGARRLTDEKYKENAPNPQDE